MKKVNLLAAAVLAAAFAMPAQADYTPNAYFGGFLRTGVQSKSLFADDAEKAHLGRLGYEPGTYGEIVLGTDIAKVDDTVWSVSSRVGYRADKNWDWYTQNDSGSHIAFREYFLNVKGFFDFDKDANIWTGKRFYRDDTYVNDWRYYDLSGLGAGVENISLGEGKLSLAWLRRDESRDYLWDSTVDASYVATDTDGKRLDKDGKVKSFGTVNFLDVKYAFPVWDGGNLQLRHTSMIPHRNSDSYFEYAHAEHDYKGAQRYSVAFNQGFSLGWNKTEIIYDHGSNVNWGAFGNGGWIDPSGCSNKAYRWSLFNFGVVNFTERFGLAHNLYMTYSSGYDNTINSTNATDKKSDKAFQLTLRPFYQLTKMTKLELEGAFYTHTTKSYFKNDANDAWAGTKNSNAQGQKLSLAYVISPDASNFWSKPEIQFFVTYLHGNENGLEFSEYGSSAYQVHVDSEKGPVIHEGTKTTNTVIFGVHGEAWW